MANKSVKKEEVKEVKESKEVIQPKKEVKKEEPKDNKEWVKDWRELEYVEGSQDTLRGRLYYGVKHK